MNLLVLLGTLLSASAGSGVMATVEVPESLEFGEALQPKIVVVNRSGAVAKILRPAAGLNVFFRLEDARTGREIGSSEGLGAVKGRGDWVTVEAGARFETRTEFWGGAVLRADGGQIEGVLRTGRYRLHATGFIGTEVSASVEFVVVPGKRSKEAEILEEALSSAHDSGSGAGPALAAAANRLRECCTASPVLDTVWAAACMRAGSHSELEKCAAEYLALYPTGARAVAIVSYRSLLRNSQAIRDEAVKARRAASSQEYRSYVKAVHAKDRLQAAREFLSAYPRSGLAPELLAPVIQQEDRAARAEEARALAQELVDRFPESEHVKQWKGEVALPPRRQPKKP